MILGINPANSFSVYSSLFLLVGLFSFLSACQQKSNNYIHLSGNAQGTTFSIIYKDSLGREFTYSIDSLFKCIDKSMSLWDSSSIISRFNANENTVVADEHFINVFNRSVYYSKLTDGVFDISIGSLAKRWGIYFKNKQAPPDSTEVHSLLHCVGWNKITLENSLVSKTDPCIKIDFNAIAQGYTVDIISVFLEDRGIVNYFVELGGEVRVSGLNESGLAWKIGIDRPVDEERVTDDKRELQKIVSMNTGALATSGNYRKFVVVGGKKHSHAINPKTGYPAHNNLLSVSVKTNKCVDADALATCFLILGLQQSLELADKLNVPVYCVYENENGALSEAITGDWQ